MPRSRKIRIAESCSCAASTTFDVLAQSIIDGETVNISKFAKFSTKDTTARTLKNIKTGEMMEVPASVRPVVKFSEGFKEAVKAKNA